MTAAADVLLWIAIGLVGGWCTATLVAGRGGNAGRGMASGALGALLGAFATSALPESGGGFVSASLAALAGSLCLGSAVWVATFGRRREARQLAPGHDTVRVTVATRRTATPLNSD